MLTWIQAQYIIMLILLYHKPSQRVKEVTTKMHVAQDCVMSSMCNAMSLFFQARLYTK